MTYKKQNAVAARAHAIKRCTMNVAALVVASNSDPPR